MVYVGDGNIYVLVLCVCVCFEWLWKWCCLVRVLRDKDGMNFEMVEKQG